MKNPITLTFKQSPRVLFIKCEKLSSSRTDLGQSILHPPDFTFVAQAKFTDQLQFLVQALLLEGTPWCRVGLL